MNKLILFSFSPVQSFIERSRKARDLYTASSILSMLSKEAIGLLETIYPTAQCIFPIDKNQESLPNRFLASFSSDDDAQTMQTRIKEELIKPLRARVHSFGEQALRNAGLNYAPEGFYQQLDSYFSFHWLVCEAQEQSYGQEYHALERNLASIKNLRKFGQFCYAGELGEQGLSCSLEGELNALFVSSQRSSHPSQDCVPLADLRSSEALSAPALLKRFYFAREEEGKFPSIAALCLLQFLNRIFGAAGAQDFHSSYQKIFRTKTRDFCQALVSLQSLLDMGNASLQIESEADFFQNFEQHSDLQFLYPENITENALPNESQRSLLGQVAANLRKKAEKKLPKHYALPKYYALLVFDGDTMGKWLSGSKLKKEYREGAAFLKFHKKFSEQLSIFAQRAQNLLSMEGGDEEGDGRTYYYGKAVYSGGDDFLAFVNLESLFPFLGALQDLLQEELQGPLKRYMELGERGLTLTASVVLAHYKEPLAGVLAQARRGEKEGKNYAGRNALAITAIKGSGEVHRCFIPWGYEQGTEALQYLLSSLKAEETSGSFITNFAALLQNLFGADWKGGADSKLGKLEPGLFAEQYRLIQRSCKNPLFSHEEQAETSKKLKLALETLWQALRQREKELVAKETRPFHVVAEYVQALLICDFMHRKLLGEE